MIRGHSRAAAFPFLFLLFSLIAPAAQASGTGELTGHVRSATGEPVENAMIQISGMAQRVKTGSNGAFETVIPAGDHHLLVTSARFGVASADVKVAEGKSTSVDVQLSPIYRDEVVVSTGSEARSVADVAQPIAVLEGDRLAAKQQSSLGATVENEPGVSTSYYGPAVGRPILRGLASDRVRILSNGTDLGDASSFAPDHAVAIDPALAERIEVLRGAGTLLYGSSAGGGVVNVIDDRIPETLLGRPLMGEVAVGGGTVSDERRANARLQGSVGSIGWYAANSYRKTDDYSIPGFASVNPAPDEPRGVLRNTAVDSTDTILGLSLIGSNGFFGVAGSRIHATYGLPLHGSFGDDGEPEKSTLAQRQNRVDVHGELRTGGFFEAIRVKAGISDYMHVERESPEDPGQQNLHKTNDVRLEVQHAAQGSLTGSFGLQAVQRDSSVIGQERTVPPNALQNVAVFALEELVRVNHRWQLGARFEEEHTRGTEEELARRTYRDVSSSLGYVWTPRPDWSVGVSVARSVKFPSAEELYSNGDILATQTFEIGNVDLRKEVNFDTDLSIRKLRGRVTGELNLFVKRFDNFIYQRATGEEHDELPVLAFVNADALFRGAEVRGAVALFQRDARLLSVEAGLDFVHAEVRDTHEPLPRIPPLKLGGTLRYEDGKAWVEGGVWRVSTQTRVAPLETETPGYTTVHAAAGYNFVTQHVKHEIFIRGTNLNNAEIRAHTSFLKDFAPEPGRDVSITYRVVF